MCKTVWITGASSGIGAALAVRYSEMGCRVIMSARNVERLESVRQQCVTPDNCFIVPLDLSDQTSLAYAADEVLSRFCKVDILINNGGISQRSMVAETPIDIDRRVMEVDYFSGVYLTKRVLPSMLEHGGGHIVAISSIVGVFGFPQRSAYSAAKHAIHGFYETVWAELHDRGIGITIVCPGRIMTDISLHALTKDGTEHGIMDHAQQHGISARTCANRIVRAVERGRKEIYVCQKDILMVYFHRYMRWLYYALVSKVKPNS